MIDIVVIVGIAAVIVVAIIIGYGICEMVHKRREKKELEEWKEFLRKKKEEDDVERCRKDYLEMLEKYGGSYLKWPEGPEIVNEADVRPNPNVIPPPYDVVEEK